MHARSAGPERRRVSVQSRLLLHPSPVLTPWLHSSMVDHGDGRIPAIHRAVHRSRQASSRISTHPSCANSRLMRGGIGAGEFDIGVGGTGVVDAGVGAGAGMGVGVGAGAGAGGAGAEAGAATMGTSVGIDT